MEQVTKPSLSAKLLEKATSMLSFGLFKKKEKEVKFDTPEDALGEIFKLMKKMDSDRKLELEEEQNHLQEKSDEEDKRNKELIKALTGRKPGKPRIRKTTKKKEKEPKTEKGKKNKKTPEAEKTTTKPPQEVPKPQAPKPAGKTPAIPSVGTGVAAAAVGAGLAVSASSVIAKEEGVSKDKKTGQVAAYWDPPGQKNLVSIGYGHQIKPEEYKQGFIEAGDEKIQITGERGIDTRMSMDQAKKLLEIDTPKYEKRARDPLGDSWNKLSDEQKTALISYAYNTGSTQSLVKQGLKDAIDRGDMKGAAEIIREKGIRTAKGQFMPELDKRRRREADMFESGIKKQVPPTVGASNNLSSASTENQNLNLQADMSANKNKTTVNNTQVDIASSSKQSQSQKDYDDRPAILRKAA